ncbi:MAG TPA: choice-of-anchor U domain-containing protein [Gammaproteobacteria bacterium]|nr:choice-of-anchor U domain-containing protein [Gammaproteobacteria bacterium]
MVVLQPDRPINPSSGEKPDSVPYVQFDMEFLADPGASVSVGVFVTEPLAGDTRWMLNAPDNGWKPFTGPFRVSRDRRSADLEFTDGGAGDLDGKVNGTITTRGGIGVFASAPAPRPDSSSGGGGGAADWFFMCLAMSLLNAGRRGRLGKNRSAATEHVQMRREF